MTSTISLRHFLKIIFEHKRLMIVLLLLVNGGVLFYNILAPRVFESSAKVYVESVAEELALMQKARPFADPPSAEQLLSTESEIITSFIVLKNAWEEVKGVEPTAQDVERLKSSIQIMPVRKANVLDITLQAEDAQVAADLLNALLREYNTYRGSIKVADSSTQYLDGQLASIKATMDSLYVAQDQLVTEHGLADYENSMRLLSTSMYELESALRVKKERQSELNSLASHMEMDLRVFAGDMDASLTVLESWSIVRNLMSQFEEARTALRVAEEQYTVESADVKRVRAKVSALKRQLEGAFKAQLAEVRRQSREAGSEISSVERELNEKRSTLLSIPEVQSRYMSAQSAIDNLSSLYGDLTKARAAKGSQDNSAESINISVISPAYVTPSAKYPRIFQNTILGFFASFIFSLALLYIIESMDSSIKFSDDLEKLGIRYLVGVPARK